MQRSMVFWWPWSIGDRTQSSAILSETERVDHHLLKFGTSLYSDIRILMSTRSIRSVLRSRDCLLRKIYTRCAFRADGFGTSTHAIQ